MNYLKKAALASVLAGSSLWTVCAQDAITLSHAQPAPGERVHITLQSEAPATNYQAQIYVFHPSGYNADDLALDGLTGTYLLPDSATAFLVNFTTIGTNAKSGLASPLYRDGKPVPGAHYAYSVIYDGFGAHFSNIDADSEQSIRYLEKEFDAHPASKEQWLAAYASKLTEGDRYTHAEHMINARVREAFGNPASTEKQLRHALALLRAIDEDEAADSLTQATIARFPNGVTATLPLFNDFRRETDYAKKAALYGKLMAIEGDLPASNIQFMHGEMAKAAAKAGDNKKVDEYIAAIANPASRANTLNSIAWPLAEAGEDLPQAEKLSKQSISIIDGLIAAPESSKPAGTTLSQWKRQLSENTRPSLADTYALIRYKQGALDDALRYQRVAAGNYTNAAVNERLVSYLKESGLREEALQAGEQAARKGKANEQTKAAMREIYLASGNTEQAFADYYAGAEADYLDGLRQQLLGQLLDEEAPAFNLKNLDGTSVTSQSMQGKVYVVDFWATWCGPCLASFPAMQTAVNLYEERDDVEFLFINTWENIPNRESAVAKFITDNDYTFHVLFDTVDESRRFDIVTAYQVSGIPTKFVVDKEGKIRFKAVGYSGSTEEEVHKLRMMIELATDPEAHSGE